MPIYEYECAKCGHIMEVIQKISDAALTKCPVCQKRSLRKRVSAAAFHLKGTGWYATDFKDKSGGKKDKPADVPAAGDNKKSETTATDNKKSGPDKKSETIAAK